MAKDEKIVDLKPTNVTEEELKKLQELVNALNRTQIEIGSLETRKHSLAHQVIALQQNMKQLQDELEKVYGKVDINIVDGTLAYLKDEQADKKD